MSLGEIISRLCEYCANDDWLLMAKSVERIDCNGEMIIVEFADSNTRDLIIEKG